MNVPRWIVLAVLALGLTILAAGSPGISTAQTPNGAQAPMPPVPEAQGYGMISLPVPAAPGTTTVTAPQFAPLFEPGSAIHGTNVRAAGGPNTGTQSELSIASVGQNIVLTFNGGPNGSGFVTSRDGGVTFSANASPTTPAGSAPCCDPGLVADQLGRFYFLQIFFDDGANTPNPGNCTNSIHLSTNGGQTFGNIVGSAFSYAPGTADFPDQPHIAIDSVNLVNGQPQLYVFTRHFTSGINCPVTGGGGSVQGEVACSTDGGVNWTAPIVMNPFTDIGGFGTGSDGSVYLIGMGIGTQANTTRILLRRSTASCNAGLNFGAPVVVADNLTFFIPVDREFVRAYVVADRISPNIAYVVWSSDRLTSDNDRDVFLARCSFTGTTGTCEAPVRVNDNPVGDGTAQYFPMMCINPNNTIGVTWNDQRAGGNSTAIYHAEVNVSGPSLGVGPNYLTSDISFVPFNFGGSPDYGDYNENNGACDATHFYAAWTSQVSPPGILPASNDPDVFFAVINNLMDIRVNSTLDFGTMCLGSSKTMPLEVFNVGDATLTVNSVSVVAGSPDITVDANPTVPATVMPAQHVDFSVRCTPTSFGIKTATVRVASNDPDQPQIDLTYTCNVQPPNINTTIADNGFFGDVCPGCQKDLTLQILNQGACNLNVSSITSSDVGNFVLPAGLQLPAVLSPDSHMDVPVRFQPNPAQACGSAARTANITVASDDPDQPALVQPVSGVAPCPVASSSGALDFGQLCVGDSRNQSVKVCDTGKCNLQVTGVSLAGPNCANFTLVNPPTLPLTVSPDSCFDFTVQFKPSSYLSPQPDCSLKVNTTDPNNATITFPITASIGKPQLVLDPPSLSGLFAFPPTVSDPNRDLGCYSDKTVVIRNAGTCPAKITNISAGATPPFSVIAPTQFPITLPPGEETLKATVRFAPTSDGSPTVPEETTGTLTITSDDPAGNKTGGLCGEAVVQSGGRWLVVDKNDQPINGVDSLTLQSFGINTPSPINIRLKNVFPTTVLICGNTVRYHLLRENLPSTQTTGSNPKSSYTIGAKEGNLQLSKSFTLGKCEYVQDILKLVKR